MGGEIVHAGETHLLSLKQPVPHAPARVRRVHAADHGDFLHDRQHFKLADLHRHGVSVAVSHQAAARAVSGHAEAAGIVNDDEVGPAAFDEFGADARAGAGGDDRLAFAQDGAEPFNDIFAGVGVTLSGPGVGHGRSVAD